MQKSNKNSFPLNLFTVVEDYFNRMLEEINGMKCLILDKETTQIISLICSRSQILKKNVYLIETMESQKNLEEKLLHLNAVFFIRPTNENVVKLVEEIKDRRFNEYHLFFSNHISDHILEKLAEEDSKNCIKRIMEVYSDFYVMNQDLFSLNILNSSGLRRPQSEWKSVEETLFDRIVDGISGACFSLKLAPYIRYQQNSTLCEKISAALFERFHKEVRDSPNTFGAGKPVLIVMERKEDPITPLLTQWTYQSMIHEFLGIQNNVTDLSKDKNYQKKEEEETKLVLSPHVDHFFAEHMYEDFGQFANSVKGELDEYSSAKKQHEKIESLDDMQRVLDSMPELKKKTATISKHVTLTSEITALVSKRKLMDISQLEQEIWQHDKKKEHLDQVLKMLGQSFDNFDKLKLAIIYALKHESDMPSVSLVKNKLKDEGLSGEIVELIDHVLRYAGKTQRRGDLFSQKNLVNLISKKAKQYFKEVPNLLTQHEPYICTLIDQVSKAKLKESEFASKSSYRVNEKPSEVKPSEIILFIVGGVTYEEAKFVADLNKKGSKIILGGTNVINSKLFLGEIKEYENMRNDHSINIDDDSAMGSQGSKGYGKLD